LLAEKPELAERRHVVIVPGVNPDGLHAGRRTNDHGVDLNRNFPAASWSARVTSAAYHPGPAPASEPETQALISLVNTLRPEKIISIHSILRGRQCNNYDGPGAFLAAALAAHNGYPVNASIGYPTPGSFGSWAGVDRQIPTVTLELPRGGDATYPTDLADGGRTGWRVVQTADSGWVDIAFPEVRWEPLNEHHGWVGSLWQGWALGDFVVEEAGRYLAQCLSTGSFFVDAKRLPGDRYGDGYAWFPVSLERGIHTLRVKVGGFSTDRFNCHFRPIEGPLTVLPGDDTLPDVVGGEIVTDFLSVPVLNTTGEWLRGVHLALADERAFRGDAESIPVDLAPGQAMPLVLEKHGLWMFSEHPCDSGDSVEIPLEVRAEGIEPVGHTVSLRCRGEGQSYRYTFLDFDDSVHYAAVIPPSAPCPDGGCPVILTTHGAGVRAEGQADAYHAMEGAWILAPTGRRRFGYDWEGPGRKNAMRALFVLPGAAMQPDTAERSLLRFLRVNSRLVVFTGHSMGGHGAWSLSTRYPDFALAAAPAAGWIKFQQYVPYFTRVGDSHADPTLKGILESAIAEHDTDLYAGNLKGIPVLARVGGDDDSVPPWHLRRMARLIEEQGGDATVSEIAGKGHWWGGVVHDEEMEAFFAANLAALPPLPERFTLTALNPASSGSKGGLRIHRLEIPYRVGRVHADLATPGVLALTTENVSVLRLAAKAFAWQVAALDDRVETVVVDGQEFLPADSFWLCKESGRWSACTVAVVKDGRRNTLDYGPARQVLEGPGPLAIVYGTQGTPEETSHRLEIAVRLANDWYLRGRGMALVYPDTALTTTKAQAHNLILVGGPATNSWAGRLNPVPVAFSGRAFTIGGREFAGAATGLLALGPWERDWPYPEGATYPGLVLVLAGTDEAGLDKAVALFPSGSGATVPDWVVAGPEFGWKGAGGLLGAGFWGNDWEFLPEMSYLR
ncbi:DUF2817 domain-containing protein, partial [bacterium]|nr:DUF2817 domain-containing protein [bacterium]